MADAVVNEEQARVLGEDVVRAVFEKDRKALEQLPKEDLNAKDRHGNTPLMLAVLLQDEDLALHLLQQGSDLRKTHAAGWDVLSEAVCLGFSDLIKATVRADQQQTSEEMQTHKEKLGEICRDMQDFHLEIAWDIHSWVPLVSRMLPRDVLRIWKQGHIVRVDSELIDLADACMAKRSLSTLIHIPQSSDEKLIMYRLDREHKLYSQHIALPSDEDPHADTDEEQADTEYKCAVALSTPLLDIDIIARDSKVSRVMTGFFGMGSPKTEAIGDYECDVYSLADVRFVTRKRKEHLSPQLKAWQQRGKRAFQQGDFDMEEFMSKDPPPVETTRASTRPSLTYDEYTAMSEDAFKAWLTAPYAESTKTKLFTSTLWMSSEFPLSIDRIVALLSPFEHSSDVIRTLVKFLRTKLPPGFPVKLDIPVLPTVSARIVFKDFSYGPFDEDVTSIPPDFKEGKRTDISSRPASASKCS